MLRKRNKIIAAFLTFLCITAHAQQKGFFKIYEDNEESWCASSVVETSDGSFLVSLFDYYGGAAKLVKLSEDGTLLNEVVLPTDDMYSNIEGVFCAPQNENLFYGIGHVIHRNEDISLPIIVHLDKNLNLLYTKEIDLPNSYRKFGMARALLIPNDSFIYAASLDASNAYHRLYMSISLDGDLENFHEESEGCGSDVMVNAIFKFPQSLRYGEYRNSYKHQGSLAEQQRLFGFDEDFVFDTIHEYESIEQTSNDTTYSIVHYSVANGTALPFGDSTLLFSDRALEGWKKLSSGITFRTDRSTLLFSTDLEGNIHNYLIIGSGNDTVEYPIAFNAIDFVKPIKGEAQREVIYHGCFGTNNGYIPSPSPYNITLTKTDGTLNLIWQRSYTHPSKFLQATNLIATRDEGCLVVGGAFENGHYDFFALKINAEGIVGTNEIIAESLPSFVYYPNPTQDQLHLQYSPDVKPRQVELYDLQGRLVRTQQSDLENIDIQGLATGQYLMKVTLEDGKVYSDKVVKE